MNCVNICSFLNNVDYYWNALWRWREGIIFCVAVIAEETENNSRGNVICIDDPCIYRNTRLLCTVGYIILCNRRPRNICLLLARWEQGTDGLKLYITCCPYITVIEAQRVLSVWGKRCPLLKASSYLVVIGKWCSSHHRVVEEAFPLLIELYLEDCWPCVDRLSVVNPVTGTVRWRMAVWWKR